MRWLQWRTRDGRVLKIADMETEHLENAVAMIRRQGGVTHAEFADAWRGYLCLQGEFAREAAAEAIAGMRVSRQLEAMEAELARRRGK
jgi:hypothetical protein